MCDRENLDFVAAERVDETEGESLEQVAAGSTAVSGPPLGSLRNRIDSMAQFYAETASRCRVSSGVPVIRGFHLLRCGRMEPDSRCGHLALVQTRSKLFPWNRLDGARV